MLGTLHDMTSWGSGSGVVYLDADSDSDVCANLSRAATYRGEPVMDRGRMFSHHEDNLHYLKFGGKVQEAVGAVRSNLKRSSSSSAVLRSSTSLTACHSLDMERLAADELLHIHAMIKERSARIGEKERLVQQSEVEVAQATCNARAALRVEAEALLKVSQRDLRRDVASQRRRLDDLFEKTREEFRKVVAWKREVRTMKDAMAATADEQTRLTQRLQEAERRCKVCVDREKNHKQALVEERGRWEEERQRLEFQQRRLQKKVQELQQSCNGGGSGAKMRKGSRSSSGCRHKEEDDSEHKMLPSQGAGQAPMGAGKARAQGTTLSEDVSVSLMGAWWTLDAMAGPGDSRSSADLADRPRSECGSATSSDGQVLWGYSALLAQTIASSEQSDRRPTEVTALHSLAGCFLRRWSWRLLTDVAKATLSSADAVNTSSCHGNAAASAGESRSSTRAVERNALAWARQQRQADQRSSTGSPAAAHDPLGQDAVPGHGKFLPFDIRKWLPGPDGPLGDLRSALVACLVAPSLASTIHSDLDAASVTMGGNVGVVLMPVQAQRRLAAALWRDARRQLMEAEPALRDGYVDPGILVEAAKALLVVSCLSVQVEVNDALAALRALLRLSASHAASLREGFDREDIVALFQWLLDAAVASSTHDAARRSTMDAVRELIAALLPVLTSSLQTTHRPHLDSSPLPRSIPISEEKARRGVTLEDVDELQDMLRTPQS